MNAARQSVWTLLGRSLSLRCPRCGQGRLFRGPFAMYAVCDRCSLPFAREPGFYLGSIYVNYGLTAVLTSAGYLAMFFAGVHPPLALAIAAAFTVLFPLWFFRYARSIWLGFDQHWDPRDEPDRPGDHP